MAEKKISFGFKLVKKQPTLLPIKTDDEKKNDVELIQCLEGQAIKLVHEKEKEKPLVIPLKNSQKTSTALASLRNLQTVLNGEDGNDASTSNTKANEQANANGAMSLEQRVVQELLNEAKNADVDSDAANGEKLTLPLETDKLAIEGAKESSLDDYENIPIAQFGLAMLRGMGLTDDEIKSKENKEPELRPKGMGLGADKVVKKAKLLVAPSANETLEIKKNAYVRILGGKHKDLYGQIEGFDDHACRIVVRLALGGNKEAFNEFLIQPVTKQEYQQYGKVINSAKYEEYKKKQDEKDSKKEIKTEIKTEVKSEKRKSPERNNSDSKSNQEANYKSSSDRRDYATSSRRRSEDRNTERIREHSRDRNRDNRDRNREKSRDRNRRSSSYDRNQPKAVDRSSYTKRHENRHSRSTDKYNSYSSSSRADRSREDKPSRRQEKPRSASESDSNDSDSSDDSRHNKRSHHKKSKKKHKKSSKKYDNSDDDRHIKKKTKKSKRERSRSHERR